MTSGEFQKCMEEWERESEEYDLQETAANSEGKSEAEAQETENNYDSDEHQGGVEHWGAKR